jgi:hypothetical protein
VLTAGGALVSDLGDTIAHDPEVRQTRMIADVARTRLLACLSGSEDVVDFTEARSMLDALGNAQALAEDAEDRVLMHHGLLTSGEAERRAARRRPAAAVRITPPPADARLACRGLRVAACVLGVAALGAAGVVLTHRRGVRLPLGRS